MSRRLSNIEFGTFLHDVDVRRLNLPPWGGIVEWYNQKILVYLRPQEVFLTDVTDEPELLSNIVKQYDSSAGVWYYRIPEEFLRRSVEVAEQAGNLASQVVENIPEIGAWSERMGTLAIVGGLIVLAVLYVPRPSR